MERSLRQIAVSFFDAARRGRQAIGPGVSSDERESADRAVHGTRRGVLPRRDPGHPGVRHRQDGLGLPERTARVVGGPGLPAMEAARDHCPIAHRAACRRGAQAAQAGGGYVVFRAAAAGPAGGRGSPGGGAPGGGAFPGARLPAFRFLRQRLGPLLEVARGEFPAAAGRGRLHGLGVLRRVPAAAAGADGVEACGRARAALARGVAQAGGHPGGQRHPGPRIGRRLPAFRAVRARRRGAVGRGQRRFGVRSDLSAAFQRGHARRGGSVTRRPGCWTS